jgi:hypothetical protein
MVTLYDKDTGTKLGEVPDEQFQFLVDQLEEESSQDRDYYIDSATIDMLEEAGADSGLVALLRRALGTRDGIDVRWERT